MLTGEVKENLKDDCILLTHTEKKVRDRDFLQKSIGVYEHINSNDENRIEEMRKKLQEISLFFWTGEKQFDFYAKLFPFILEKDNHHFSGYGKTFMALKEEGINLTSFPSMSSFFHLLRGHRGTL